MNRFKVDCSLNSVISQAQRGISAPLRCRLTYGIMGKTSKMPGRNVVWREIWQESRIFIDIIP